MLKALKKKWTSSSRKAARQGERDGRSSAEPGSATASEGSTSEISLRKQEKLAAVRSPIQSIGAAETPQQQRMGPMSFGSDAERSEADQQTVAEALERIYRDIYPDAGKRRQLAPQENLAETIYDLLAVGDNKYLQQAITKADYKRLTKIPNSQVSSQTLDELSTGKGNTPSARSGEKGNRSLDIRTIDDALLQGDYFKVRNKKFAKIASPAGGVRRRIVVNLATQQAALEVARKLGDLFQTEVAPNLEAFKVLLCTKLRRIPTKHDKIVVYYRLGEGGESWPDVIGERIVAAIEAAVSDAEMVAKLPPFYTHITRAIGWGAEPEPEHSAEELEDSFTQTRAKVIANVIDINRRFTQQKFMEQVIEELKNKDMLPGSPPRHETTAAPGPSGPLVSTV